MRKPFRATLEAQAHCFRVFWHASDANLRLADFARHGAAPQTGRVPLHGTKGRNTLAPLSTRGRPLNFASKPVEFEGFRSLAALVLTSASAIKQLKG